MSVLLGLTLMNGKFPKMSHGLTVSSVIVMKVSPHGKWKKTIEHTLTQSVALLTMGMLWEISRACTAAAILAVLTFDFSLAAAAGAGVLFLNTFRKYNVFDFFYLTNAIGDGIIYIHKPSPLPKIKEIIHMAKHRSAFQLLQDAQKKISKLKERVAREVVSDHKEIKVFDSRILNVQKELTKVRRWTNEDNGLAVRITKLQAQIEKCREDLTNAESIQAGLETDIAILKEQRKTCAKEILESQDIDIDSLMEQEIGE